MAQYGQTHTYQAGSIEPPSAANAGDSWPAQVGLLWPRICGNLVQRVGCISRMLSDGRDHAGLFFESRLVGDDGVWQANPGLSDARFMATRACQRR